MTFTLEKQLEKSSLKLFDLPLCEVRLRNNHYFPWIILIPRVSPTVTEIFQLNSKQQKLLINEISTLSKKMKAHFQADKINIGALGNIVSQLHIHIIARFKTDLAWPNGVWKENIAEKSYDATDLQKQINQLRTALS